FMKAPKLFFGWTKKNKKMYLSIGKCLPGRFNLEKIKVSRTDQRGCVRIALRFLQEESRINKKQKDKFSASIWSLKRLLAIVATMESFQLTHNLEYNLRMKKRRKCCS